MAFTYDISTNRGKVRFYVGDTNSSDYVLEDAEIDFLLTENNGSVRDAAIGAAEAIIAELSRCPDSKSVGSLSLSFSSRIANLKGVIASLRRQSNKFLVPYVGGLSRSGKEVYDTDSDLVQPAFKREFMSDIDQEEDE
jgi:hypothetical protein